MMSSLANALLFVALVATSTIVAVMYRKLKRLDAYHAEYKAIFDQTAEALSSAQKAVAGFSQESRDTLVALGAKVEEAKILINEIGARAAAQSNSSITSSVASHS
jgi:hypothetical protein